MLLFDQNAAAGDAEQTTDAVRKGAISPSNVVATQIDNNDRQLAIVVLPFQPPECGDHLQTLHDDDLFAAGDIIVQKEPDFLRCSSSSQQSRDSSQQHAIIEPALELHVDCTEDNDKVSLAFELNANQTVAADDIYSHTRPPDVHNNNRSGCEPNEFFLQQQPTIEPHFNVDGDDDDDGNTEHDFTTISKSRLHNPPTCKLKLDDENVAPAADDDLISESCATINIVNCDTPATATTLAGDLQENTIADFDHAVRSRNNTATTNLSLLAAPPTSIPSCSSTIELNRAITPNIGLSANPSTNEVAPANALLTRVPGERLSPVVVVVDDAEYQRALQLLPERIISASTRTFWSRAICLLFQLGVLALNQYIFIFEFIAFNMLLDDEYYDDYRYFYPHQIAEPLIYLIPDLFLALSHAALYYYCYWCFCPRIPRQFYLHPEDLLNAERLYAYVHAEAWQQVGAGGHIKPDVDNEDASVLTRLKYCLECTVPGPIMLRKLAFDLVRQRLTHDDSNGVTLHERMPYYDNQRVNVIEIGHRTCKFCLLLKPDRCHHCAGCGVCVMQRDHHCIYMQNCVHVNNLKQFLLMLLAGIVLCLWQAIVVAQFLIRQDVNLKQQLVQLDRDALVRQYVWVFVLYLTILTCGVFNLSLISIEMVRHASRNCTMIEALRATYLASDDAELRLRMLLITNFPYERRTRMQNWRQVLGQNVWQWLIPYKFSDKKNTRRPLAVTTNYEIGEESQQLLDERCADARRNVYDYFELERRIRRAAWERAQSDGVLIPWQNFRKNFVDVEYFTARRRRSARGSVMSLFARRAAATAAVAPAAAAVQQEPPPPSAAGATAAAIAV